MALDVGGLDDAIVRTELALGARVEQLHVSEGAAVHEHSRLARDRAALGLDRVDLDAEIVLSRVLELELLSLALLLLGERQNWGVVRVDSADAFIRRGRVATRRADDLAEVSVAIERRGARRRLRRGQRAERQQRYEESDYAALEAGAPRAGPSCARRG